MRRIPVGTHDVAHPTPTSRRLESRPPSDVRVPARGSPRAADPGCQVLSSHAGVRGCTTRQRNTHSTEVRQVRYPWHPWFGRSVTVYEALTKDGHAISRCGVDDRRNDRSVEVPAWMFEPGACDHLRLTATPYVDCRALIALKAVLQTRPRADVLQAPHHSLTAPGGADATGQRPIPRLATDPVHPPPRRPHFQMLPPDIQERTIRLLARLLRQQADQPRVRGEAREARDE
jgi:hypothetical protein